LVIAEITAALADPVAATSATLLASIPAMPTTGSGNTFAQ